tara:strand:- start:1357 stop:1641 length:285 start_codon:yes stop_codon:yes gene_type:complete
MALYGLYLNGGLASEMRTIPTVNHHWELPFMGYAHGAFSIVSFFAQLFDKNLILLWYDAPNNYQFYVHTGIFSTFILTYLSQKYFSFITKANNL